jgi:hypothetical protein
MARMFWVNEFRGKPVSACSRFVDSCGAIARLAEVARRCMAGAKLEDAASTIVVMPPSCAANSKQRDPNCQSRLHERLAAL